MRIVDGRPIYDDEDEPAVRSWWNGLPPEQRKAAVTTLALDRAIGGWGTAFARWGWPFYVMGYDDLAADDDAMEDVWESYALSYE